MSEEIKEADQSSLAQVLDRLLKQASEEKPPSFRKMVEAANLDPATDFVGASLQNIDLRDEDLRGFDFSGADLTGADFRRANVRGAKFGRANLIGAIGLPPEIVHEPHILDLGETLSDMGVLLRRLLGDGFALAINHSRDLWPVRINISDLEMLIVNLLVGIRDQLPTGGTIVVGVFNLVGSENFIPPAAELQGTDHVVVEIKAPKIPITRRLLQKLIPALTYSGKGSEDEAFHGISLVRSAGELKGMEASLIIQSVQSDTFVRLLVPRYQRIVKAVGKA